MDFKKSTQTQGTPRRAEEPVSPATKYQVVASHSEKPLYMKLIFMVIALVLVGSLLYGAWALSGLKNAKSYSGIKSDQHQAVFLTNGQVYFGKLSDLNDGQVKLSHIFYLQVQQKVQPADTTKDKNQVSLAKLGEELHGPEDTMFISKDQILFWENLKNNSKVVEAIKNSNR